MNFKNLIKIENLKFIIIIIVLFGTIMSAMPVQAAGLVTCGLKSQDVAGTTKVEGMCTRCDILVLFKDIVDFITFRLTPAIATLLILLSGFMLVLGGASPETITTGKKMFSNAIIGVFIVYSSWMIANFFIQSLAGTDNVAKSWFELECVNPPEQSRLPGATSRPPGTGNTGDNTRTPEGQTTPGGFRNDLSPELASFKACLDSKLGPGDHNTSTTDKNIALGTCDPLGANENFRSSTNCQHRNFSQHYGGTSAACQANGSYALDYVGNYDRIQEAAWACDGRAYVLLEDNPVHMHISIGGIYGCGPD